jgi:GTPase SAR1 family protein
MLDSWISYADGFILVYAIDDKESFEAAKQKYERVIKTKQEIPAIILIGNKCDLIDKRRIEKSDAEQFAKTKGIKFMEVSALEKINVKETFLTVATDLLYKQLKINTQGEEKERKRCYCF